MNDGGVSMGFGIEMNLGGLATHLLTISIADGREYQFKATFIRDDDVDKDEPLTIYKVRNGEKDKSTYIEWTDEDTITIRVNNELIIANLIDSNVKEGTMDFEIECECDGANIHIQGENILGSDEKDVEDIIRTTAYDSDGNELDDAEDDEIDTYGENVEDMATHIVTIDFDDGCHYQFDAYYECESDGSGGSIGTMYKYENGEKDYCTYVEWSGDNELTICLDNNFTFASIISSNLEDGSADVKFDCIDDDGMGVQIICYCLLTAEIERLDKKLKLGNYAHDDDASNEYVNEYVDLEHNIKDNIDVTGADVNNEGCSNSVIFIIMLIISIVPAYLLTAFIVGDYGSTGEKVGWFIAMYIIMAIVCAITIYNADNGFGDTSIFDGALAEEEQINSRRQEFGNIAQQVGERKIKGYFIR